MSGATLSTHVLDTANARPASVSRSTKGDAFIASATTGEDGRIPSLGG